MTELELLNRIAINTTSIKAFCYALAVLIALSLIIWTINKLLVYTIGRA